MNGRFGEYGFFHANVAQPSHERSSRAVQGQLIFVQPTKPSVPHVHVLQPSPAGNESPGMYVMPLYVHIPGVQAISVHPTNPSAPHVHVLQPSVEGNESPD